MKEANLPLSFFLLAVKSGINRCVEPAGAESDSRLYICLSE